MEGALVSFTIDGVEKIAKAVGIANDGALKVSENGIEINIYAGDVNIHGY